MKERSKTHTHHIDLHPGNNTPSNLIKLDRGLHRDLHNQLRYLFDKWELGNSKTNIYYAEFVKHFLKTGELIFDRCLLEYRFNPIPGKELHEYYEFLISVGMKPPLRRVIPQNLREIYFKKKEFLSKITLVVVEGWK